MTTRLAESGADTARAAAVPAEFIGFAIGDDQYGVDIMAVREITGWSDVTFLPKQRDYVRGFTICAGSWCRSSICAAVSARA